MIPVRCVFLHSAYYFLGREISITDTGMGGGSMEKNKNREQFQHDHEEIPKILPVIPTIDVVVFPHMVVPLLILDEKIIKGIESALNGSKKI